MEQAQVEVGWRGLATSQGPHHLKNDRGAVVHQKAKDEEGDAVGAWRGVLGGEDDVDDQLQRDIADQGRVDGALVVGQEVGDGGVGGGTLGPAQTPEGDDDLSQLALVRGGGLIEVSAEGVEVGFGSGEEVFGLFELIFSRFVEEMARKVYSGVEDEVRDVGLRRGKRGVGVKKII